MNKREIKFDPRNYRIHGEKNKKLINKSLSECGAGRSILLDKDNVIIAGNGVYEQAESLGIPVRIIETDGTELIAVKRNDLNSGDKRRKLLAFADNQTSDTSLFDMDLLIADFDAVELDVWELDTDLFSDTTVDDLQQNRFVDNLKEKSDVFDISFSFPKEFETEVTSYIKENGKGPLLQLMIDHICHAAEVK